MLYFPINDQILKFAIAKKIRYDFCKGQQKYSIRAISERTKQPTMGSG